MPGLEVILRTTVPRHFFEHKLECKWVLQEVQLDIGCLQEGPLDFDVEKTWEAHRHFHQHWTDRVGEEAEAIRASDVDLVIANISHLGIVAGIQARKSVVAVSSFCWDQILLHLSPVYTEWQQKILADIQEAYAQASHLIRLNPGIAMPAFPRSSTVGPSWLPLPTITEDIRKSLRVPSKDQLVLVAFGGIPFNRLPLEKLEELGGFHFVLSGVRVPKSFTRPFSWEELNLPFLHVLRQADVVMTKPGYSTVVTAVHYGIPLVYVRRKNFMEEENLAAYAHQYGRAFELPEKDFETGEWRQVLEKVREMPCAELSPPQAGVREAVDILKTFLTGERVKVPPPSVRSGSKEG